MEFASVCCSQHEMTMGYFKEHMQEWLWFYVALGESGLQCEAPQYDPWYSFEFTPHSHVCCIHFARQTFLCSVLPLLREPLTVLSIPHHCGRGASQGVLTWARVPYSHSCRPGLVAVGFREQMQTLTMTHAYQQTVEPPVGFCTTRYLQYTVFLMHSV